MKKIFVYIFLLSISFASAQNKLSEKDRLSFESNFFDGMNERLKENYGKSNEYFQQCLSIDDKNDVVLFKIAQNFLDNNKPQEALIYIEKAKEYNPNNKWYQKTYIEIRIELGTDQKEIAKLLNDFKPILKNPYVLSSLYRKMYYKNKPKVTYTTPRAKTANKDILIGLIASGDYKKTISEGEKILENQPDNAKAYYYIALAKYKQKKQNDALEYLDMGIDFALDQKELLKKYYQLYVDIYKAQGKSKKEKKYQQKLNKL